MRKLQELGRFKVTDRVIIRLMLSCRGLSSESKLRLKASERVSLSLTQETMHMPETQFKKPVFCWSSPLTLCEVDVALPPSTE